MPNTYTADQFIDKPLYISGKIPVYATAQRQGEKKPKPIFFLKKGDTAIVYSWLNRKGKYTNYADNFLMIYQNGNKKKPAYIMLSDVVGKLDKATITANGMKSKEQIEKDKEGKKNPIEAAVKKYGIYVLGTIVVVAAAKSFITAKAK